MKSIFLIGFILLSLIQTASAQKFSKGNETLSDEMCDCLSSAARKKSNELGIDISFAIADPSGLPRLFRRFGNALVLSTTLVPGKAYTSAVTQCTTKDVAKYAAEGQPLMAIQTNDPRITLVAGGYPLFANGKIVGAIGVGGGTEAQDCEIAEYVVTVFERTIQQ